MQSKHSKWVLDYSKIEWYWGIKNFLSLSNITLSLLCKLMILKFFQDFLKLAFFFNLLIYLSIFLKSTCLLLDIFLKFIFSQKEKYGFIWAKTVDFLFLKHSIFYPEKNSCSLEFLFFLEFSCLLLYCVPSV